jgi:hypothetical protein
LRRFPFPVLWIGALLIVLAALPGRADDPPPPPAIKKITSVDAATSTVVISLVTTKVLHTYKIDDFTKLKINGIPGKFADIKSGMEIRDYLERDNDTLDELTLIGYGDDDAKK